MRKRFTGIAAVFLIVFVILVGGQELYAAENDMPEAGTEQARSTSGASKINQDKIGIGKVYVFHTIADMKHSRKCKAGDFIITTGYYSPDDGGGGIYRVIVSQQPDDGGSVHQLANGLRAVMKLDKTVNVRQFGAKGDGKSNDQPAIQMCLSKCKDIQIDDGIYMIDVNRKTLNILSDTVLNLTPNAVLRAIPNNLTGYFLLTAASSESNILIDGGVLAGDKYQHDYTKDGKLVEGSHALLYLTGAKNVTIRNMEVRESPCAGIIVINAGGKAAITNQAYRNKEIKIENCYIHDNHAVGLVIQGGDDIQVKNNVIADSVMHPLYKTPGTIEMGLDVEGQSGVTNLLIDGNLFYGSRNFGLQVYGGYPAKKVTISNNTINDGMYIYAIDYNGIPYEEIEVADCVVRKAERSYNLAGNDYFGMTFLYTGDNGRISNLTCTGFAQINGNLLNVEVTDSRFEYFTCSGKSDFISGNVKLSNIEITKDLILAGTSDLTADHVVAHGTVQIGSNASVFIEEIELTAAYVKNTNPLPTLYLTNNKELVISQMTAWGLVPGSHAIFLQVVQNMEGSATIKNSYIKAPFLSIHGPTLPGAELILMECDFSDCGGYELINRVNCTGCRFGEDSGESGDLEP